MNYDQRLSEAKATHSAAMNRVSSTPAPTGQKFPPGSRVTITANLPRYMSHFPGAGKNATVAHTYAHAFGVNDPRSLTQYCLDIDGRGQVSWYDEELLSPADV